MNVLLLLGLCCILSVDSFRVSRKDGKTDYDMGNATLSLYSLEFADGTEMTTATPAIDLFAPQLLMVTPTDVAVGELLIVEGLSFQNAPNGFLRCYFEDAATNSVLGWTVASFVHQNKVTCSVLTPFVLPSTATTIRLKVSLNGGMSFSQGLSMHIHLSEAVASPAVWSSASWPSDVHIAPPAGCVFSTLEPVVCVFRGIALATSAPSTKNTTASNVDATSVTCPLPSHIWAPGTVQITLPVFNSLNASVEIGYGSCLELKNMCDAQGFTLITGPLTIADGLSVLCQNNDTWGGGWTLAAYAIGGDAASWRGQTGTVNPSAGTLWSGPTTFKLSDGDINRFATQVYWVESVYPDLPENSRFFNAQACVYQQGTIATGACAISYANPELTLDAITSTQIHTNHRTLSDYPAYMIVDHTGSGMVFYISNDSGGGGTNGFCGQVPVCRMRIWVR